MADLLMRLCRVRVLVLAAIAATGCGPDGFQYGAGGSGPGGRKQQVALSAQQEVKLGQEAFEEVKQKEKANLHLSGPEYDQVHRIGDKIFLTALENAPLRKEIGLSDADPYGTPWVFQPEYAVVDSDEVNAFCLPSGKVVVFTGLLHLPGMKDDWLATVLGHEIAHAVAHHASERIAREQMYGQASNATAGLDSFSKDQQGTMDRLKLLDLLGVGDHVKQYARQDAPESEQPGLFAQFSELKFDRQQEEEADHIGVFFMAFAGTRYDPEHPGYDPKQVGYDPDEAVAFWQEMAKQSGDKKPPEILSDHPSDEHRIALMRNWAARAKAAWEAWKKGDVVK